MKPIKSDIRIAETLPSSFYTSNELFQKSLNGIFARSWQYVGDLTALRKQPETLFPITLLENALDEPLILRINDDSVGCMSNVCTHRGFQLIHHPSKSKKIVCGYHGRRFDLEGNVEFMPEFEQAENFPRPCDHLSILPVKQWKRFLFTGVNPKIDFDFIHEKLDERLGFLPIDEWRFAPEHSKTYHVQSNWALYCDNYLEGFHIPFVHSDLNGMIDYGHYTTECYDHMVVQIGYGKSGDNGFDLPTNHPDFGKVVVAFYYWLFPNFMLNVYNWGVQINIVKPISTSSCKVDFLYFIGDEEKWEQFGKDGLAEKVEREDEFIVENVQKAMKSRFYNTGRYSPKRENGVHYFHQLVSKYLENT